MPPSSPPKAFLAMPFRAAYDDLFQVIGDASKALGMNLVRIDNLTTTGSIIDQIRTEIRDATLMIAVVTEVNGNVYYEIGLAHCQNKPVVLLTSDVSNLMFDLKDHRAIVYDKSNPRSMRKRLIQTLRDALEPKLSAPHDYFHAIYGATSDDVGEATHKGIQNALAAVTTLAGLRAPVAVTRLELLKDSAELAVEVEDFYCTRVRAFLDRNGYVKEYRLMK